MARRAHHAPIINRLCRIQTTYPFFSTAKTSQNGMFWALNGRLRITCCSLRKACARTAIRCVTLGHDVRSVAREASAARAASFKSASRKQGFAGGSLRCHLIEPRFRPTSGLLATRLESHGAVSVYSLGHRTGLDPSADRAPLSQRCSAPH